MQVNYVLVLAITPEVKWSSCRQAKGWTHICWKRLGWLVARGESL